MSNRIITIAGSIDWETYDTFSANLLALETDDKGSKAIVHIASPGGEALAALAICSRIRLSMLLIETVCYGQASSAASLILAYGNHRSITSEGWVMVHEDSGEVTGNVVELETEVVQKRRLEKQWCKLMAQRTNLTVEQWEKLNKRTTYLSAEQCLKVGLVDQII